MRISFENGILHLVLDEVLPHKSTAYYSHSESPKLTEYRKSRRESSCQDITDRIISSFNAPLKAFRESSSSTNISEGHWVIVYCTYYHDDGTIVIDGDDVETSRITNFICNMLLNLPDDSPRYLSEYKCGIVDGDFPSRYLKEQECDEMRNISHTEVYAMNFSDMKKIF